MYNYIVLSLMYLMHGELFFSTMKHHWVLSIIPLLFYNAHATDKINGPKDSLVDPDPSGKYCCKLIAQIGIIM